MFKTSNIFYCYLVVGICLIQGFHCNGVRKQPSFKSLPIEIDQPTDLCHCESEAKFKRQISHNYAIMLKKLTELGCKCNESDLEEFKTILNEMEGTIVNIVDAYYECQDPTDAIREAIKRYDCTRADFRAYGRNAFNKLSPECNSAIQYIRRLPYISAENTITSMLTCAKLKKAARLHTRATSRP